MTIGGDLWEDENVTADTRNSVAYELGQLTCPVLLICGNHDPFLPGGNYDRTPWPENVRVFTRPEPTEHRFDGVSVWGVSWCGGRLTASFLDDFAAPADGAEHVLLLHGTATAAGGLHDMDAHCPFSPEQVGAAGFSLCLAGHLHAGRSDNGVVYPGSPEPLGWGETGRHCAAVITLEPGEEPEVALIDVATRRYEERDVDCEGAASSAEIAQRVTAALDDPDPERVYVRVVLRGEVDRDCEVDVDALASDLGGAYAALEIRDRTVPAYDLDAVAEQDTARGEFVRRLRERLAEAGDERERRVIEGALLAGLRALDGRERLF